MAPSTSLADTDPQSDAALHKIKTLSSVAWGGNCDYRLVANWLRQFTGDSGLPKDVERRQMLHLLSNFLYFGAREIQELLRSVYRDLFEYRIVQSIRRTHNDTTDPKIIRRLYAEQLNATRFLALGGPSESGTHLLYLFRQQNHLPSNLFISTNALFSDAQETGLRYPNVRTYVFLDDFAGSGAQAQRQSDAIVRRIKRANPAVAINYYVLFATTKALSAIASAKLFNEVNTVFELRDDYRAFSTTSLFFSVPVAGVSQSDSRQVAEHYGRRLFPSEPLGFRNGEMIVGFAHNVPNNTLPIFWAPGPPKRPWVAPFPRHVHSSPP